MQSSHLDQFILAFSNYIENGDPQNLTPYLADGANPAFLRIYRNGILKACVDALSSNYPTLKSYLGDEDFKTLSRNFILHFWPNDTRLSTYGAGLAEFIGNDYLPYSGDFAKLDRAWLDALFAIDQQALQSNEIETILTQEKQQDLFSLQLADSVKLVHLNTDCINQWLSLKFEVSDNGIQSATQTVLFWRNQLKVQCRLLNDFEETFIRTLQETNSILNAAEKTLTTNSEHDIGALFGALLTAGVLIKQQT